MGAAMYFAGFAWSMIHLQERRADQTTLEVAKQIAAAGLLLYEVGALCIEKAEGRHDFG
jgi:hypothetical protein